MAGRGRAATLPAWMTAGQTNPGAPQAGPPGVNQAPPGYGAQPQQPGVWQPSVGQAPGPRGPPSMQQPPPMGGTPAQGGPPQGGSWPQHQGMAPGAQQLQQQRPPAMAPPPNQQGMMQHQQLPLQNLGVGPPGVYQMPPQQPPMQQGYMPQPGSMQGYPGHMAPPPNAVSGASSYPGAMQRPLHVPGQMPSLPAAPSPGSFQSPAGSQSAPSQTGSQGAAVWTEHTAPDGRKYYFNKATQKSSWSKPADFPQSSKAAPERSDVASEWKEFTAPDGRKYYYNKVLKESKWTLPDEMKRAKEAGGATKASPGPQQGTVQVVKLEAAPASSPAAVTNGLPTGSSSPGLSTPAAKADVKSEAEQQAKQAAPDKSFMYSSKEEAKDAFKELLASVQCASDWSWEQTMRLIISDSRYSALKSLGEKRACFNEYQAQRKSEELLERKLKLKKSREEFSAMLEESADLKASTSFRKAEAMLEDDPRWKAVPKAEREPLFTDFIKEKDKKEREAKKAERKRRKAAFWALLEKSPAIKVDTPWRKAITKLEVEEEYEALEKLDRLEVYQDYITHLEKKLAEEKEKERQERRRKERQNRDAFKEMLDRHIKEGVLVAHMRWTDYHPLIDKEKCLKEVEKNTTGARPKELFEDALELADAQFEKDKAKLKEVVKEHDIAVDANSTFDGFNKALEEIEAVKDIIKPNRKLVFDELYARIKEKAAKEEKRRKRAREDFTGLLKDVREIHLDTTWEDAKPLLEKEAEYKAVSREEREELFNAYVAQLKERKEREAERGNDDEDTEKQKKKRHKKEKRERHNGSPADEDGEKKGKRSKRHAEEDGEEDKKSKRHKRDKEKRHRSRRSDAEDGDVGTPGHAAAAEDAVEAGPPEDGEL